MKTPKELEEAVKSYQNGDGESFNRIYELSYRYLYTCIVRVVKNEDAAMDMIQETYLEISRSICQLNQTEDFLSWAAMIGNRKCFAYLKKNNRMILLDSDDGEGDSDYFENIADDECFIPESILQDREKQRLMREIIDGLSDMQRLCVIGYYYNEEKQEQIAEELGIPVNTVKSHLSRAKVNIKKGVLELEEKKGTRIYSLAPFMLLFFRKEMADCVLKPMPEGLRAQLSEKKNDPFGSEPSDGRAAEKTAASKTASPKAAEGQGAASGGSLLGKLAGASLKVKVLVGAVAAAGVIAGVSATAVRQDSPGREVETEDVHFPAESVQEAPADDIVPDGDPAPVPAREPADTGKNGGQADSQPGESGGETQEESLPGEMEAEYGQLAISGQYDGLRNAQDGITIVSKNGKWGLVSYENEVLVPLEYDYACNSPNDDGQTFFGNDGDFRVFDREGNEIFRTDRTITAVSDGVVLWKETDPDSYTMDYGYVRLDGTVLYEPVEEQTSGQAGAVGFNEGYAICTDYLCEQRLSTDGELFPIFDARYPLRHPELAEPPVESSTTESSADSSDGDLFYPIGALYQGYYVSWGMPFEDVHGDIYIYDKDGTEEYPLQIRDLARYAGFSWEDPELYWTVWGFQDNGVLCHSYGTILCISLEDGEREQYFLIDAAKQDHTTDRFGYYAEPVITDASILATGDHISIDPSRYWLIQKDGQWGYVDHDGNSVAFFDDATRFSNGMAMVIEDGYARFINEDMETCSDRIPAQTVVAYGDIFAVTMPDGEQLCFESGAPQAVKGEEAASGEAGE